MSLLASRRGRTSRLRKCVLGFVLAAAVIGVSGCQTIGFYAQAIRGQYGLVAHQQKISKLQADPATPVLLKERFELLNNLREYARTNLGLPVDGHYQKYVDLHRPFVVWNVEAAPEFSLEPKTWWYPVVGRQVYRGYFSESRAREYAEKLKREGLDVSVGGSQAYSTLGWFKDPVLNTFIFEAEPDLAEVIFHELGHQEAFAKGDTDFNEAFATTVGEEGTRRWLRAKGDSAVLEGYLLDLGRTRQFAHLIMDTRKRLETLYGDELTREDKVKACSAKPAIPAAEMREKKKQILADLTTQYGALKAEWGGVTNYDAWFNKGLNNARLNSVATYYDLVPGFEQLLALNGGDLEKFYAAVQRLAEMPRKDRHEWLINLAHAKALGTISGGPTRRS
jgi:predicted aminopeptidase